MNETKVPENRAWKVTLILLLGLAAFSSAMKELNHLRGMVGSVHEFTQQWRGTDQVALNEKPISTQETIPALETVSATESCPNESQPVIESFSESGSSDCIAPPRGVEGKRTGGEPFTEKADMIAVQRPNRNAPQLARARSELVKTLKQEISSRHRDINWPARFEYKTQDLTVSLELPMKMVTDIKTDGVEHEVLPGFLVGVLGKIDRRQSHSRTENRRRELLIKRIERNINSRRAS